MADLKEVSVGSVNDTPVNLHDILVRLKFSGEFQKSVAAELSEVYFADLAKKKGIEASAEELQEMADKIREELKLHKAEDTKNWLFAMNLTADDLEKQAFSRIIQGKLKKSLISDDEIKNYFNENRAAFEKAEVAHLVVKEEGLANELLSQLKEEEEDFAVLAREYSLDSTTSAKGGYVGWVSRGDALEDIETAIFSAKNGDIVGPLPVSSGYALYKVIAVKAPELDQQNHETVQNLLFEKWLNNARSEISFSLEKI